MNIAPQYTVQPLATSFNPQTENLRRENAQRELVTQTTPTHHSTAEKGVAKEQDRARQAQQNNEQIDFAELAKKAEQQAKSIDERHSGEHQHQGEQQGKEGESNEPSEQQKNSADPAAKQSEAKQNDEKQVGNGNSEYSEAELAQIEQLKARDQEVRRHEAAHAAVGGSATGAPSLEFEQGPDGKRYAVNGEVSVDLSPVNGDPQATIAKMQQVHSAALAPVNPSSQDKRVAAKAAQQISQAQAELMAIREQQAPSPTQVKAKEAFADNEPSQTVSTDTDLSQSLAASSEFDQHMAQTLASQEQAVPSIQAEVKQRALRIESFYQTIQHAYEQAPKYQFQLTA